MAIKDQSKPPIWPVVGRIVRQAGGLSNWLYASILIDLIMAGILILGNDYMRRFFDAVTKQQFDVFWYYVTLNLLVSLSNIPLAYVRTYGMGRFSEGALAKIRQAIARSSTRLPVSYLEERHSGDLLSVLNADLGKLKNLLGNDLINLIGQSARGLAALVYIFSINWILAGVSVLATPLIFVLVSAISNPVSKRSEEMQADIGQVNSVAQDSISGAMLVKAFNLTKTMEDRFSGANQKALKKGMRIAWLRGISDGVGFGLSITPFIIAIGLGGWLMIHNQITFGALFAFINLLNFVVNPLGSLPGIINSISEAAGAGRRVFEVVDHAAERQDGAVTSPNGNGLNGKAAVQFENVSFGYKENEPAVLKDISLDIRKGQTVAIVGPSGGGKSTLIKLILGYYPLSTGNMKLFGHNLNDWKLSAAREQMAFVAQDTYLFPVSIGENIRLGKPGASQAEVESAARMANIHDFIISLPQGYNTPAGEWGSRLSGGQKQRISLARAILKDAPILLLDEPTSALDTESERLVQQALDSFTRAGQPDARTTLVIAHRLSTIQNADKVLVLSSGEIVEQGTHEELLAKGGLYLDLYRRQFEQSTNGTKDPNGTPGSNGSKAEVR